MDDKRKRSELIDDEVFAKAVSMAQNGNYSSLGAQKNSAMHAYLNRGDFQYDINTDALYQQYRDKYIQQGQQAMQDTMGQAAALTGGYGSSYAQNVGQQTYNSYLQQLNDVVPGLYQMAYEKYQDEGNELLQRYAMLSDEEREAYARQYQQERDSVSDSQWQQSYNYQVSRDAVSDQRYADEQSRADQEERAWALAAAGDYSALAELKNLTPEQAQAYALANGITPMTEEKAYSMALMGDYSGIAQLHGMTNQEAEAYYLASNGSQMTEQRAYSMALMGDYSGYAQLYGMTNEEAAAYFAATNQADEESYTYAYTKRDEDTGEERAVYYDSDGKQVEFDVGVNPYTGDSASNLEQGTFGNAGYQPSSIRIGDGDEAKDFDLEEKVFEVGGNEFKVYRNKENGDLYTWSETKGKYVPYDGYIGTSNTRMERFRTDLMDDTNIYFASKDTSASGQARYKGLIDRRIEKWVKEDKLTENEAACLMLEYGLI